MWGLKPLMRSINEKVLEGLPEGYDDDPPLIKSMFSIPCLDETQVYRSRTMTFGVSFNCVYWERDQWFNRFEALLCKLYWSNVTMHIRPELGDRCIVVWTSTMWELGLYPVGEEVQLPPPTTEWRRQIFEIDQMAYSAQQETDPATPDT